MQRELRKWYTFHNYSDQPRSINLNFFQSTFIWVAWFLLNGFLKLQQTHLRLIRKLALSILELLQGEGVLHDLGGDECTQINRSRQQKQLHFSPTGHGTANRGWNLPVFACLMNLCIQLRTLHVHFRGAWNPSIQLTTEPFAPSPGTLMTSRVGMLPPEPLMITFRNYCSSPVFPHERKPPFFSEPNCLWPLIEPDTLIQTKSK